MSKVTLICADVLTGLSMLPDESVQCVVTSPPYWGLRDYGTLGQIGLEPTIEEFVAKMVEVFREVRRVLRSDGCCFLNLGDSYAHSQPGRNRNGTGGQIIRPYGETERVQKGNAELKHGLKPKDLCGIPWRVALALQADGWYLRSDIIWAKPNPMPESCTDRPTKAHEYIFLLTKSAHYFWDQEAVREESIWPVGSREDVIQGGFNGKRNGVNGLHASFRAIRNTRNLRSVWEIATHPFPGSHFATFPPKLVRRCVAAGTSERGCCPKCGAAWKRVVEKGDSVARPDNPNPVMPYDGDSGHNHGTGATTLHKMRELTTTGWTPTCTCNAGEPQPCTVLDPFSGAGTTDLVAAKMGRDAIGIELNPAYVEMSRKRIAGELGMLAEVTVK